MLVGDTTLNCRIMPLSILPLLLTLNAGPTVADTVHCKEAVRLLRADLHMQAIVDPDTIDDWRTGKKTPGCRVTAAGATDIGVNKEAVRFYERVRAAKWTRTPDPRDAPNEAALRFRWEQSDCLFHVNREMLLNTEAESRVNDSVKLKAGEVPYYVFVMCVPAVPAKPREP